MGRAPKGVGPPVITTTITTHTCTLTQQQLSNTKHIVTKHIVTKHQTDCNQTDRNQTANRANDTTSSYRLIWSKIHWIAQEVACSGICSSKNWFLQEYVPPRIRYSKNLFLQEFSCRSNWGSILMQKQLSIVRFTPKKWSRTHLEIWEAVGIVTLPVFPFSVFSKNMGKDSDPII